MPAQTAEQDTLKYTLLLALGALLISFAPVFVKLLAAEGMAPTPIGAWRLIFGGTLLLALALAFRKSLALSKRRWMWAALLGVIFAADLFVWHKSVIIIGAGMATILGNMQVFFTSALGSILYKEKLTTLFKIAVPLALAGVALLTGIGSELEFSARYLSGVGFGLATAVIYAIYLIALKGSSHDARLSPEEKQASPLALLGWMSLVSAGLLTGAGKLEGVALAPMTQLGWVYSFSLALIAQVLGWLAIYHSLSKLPASRAALILLLQPTFASIWGAILFHETLTLLQLGGAALTLFAIYLGSARRN